MYLESLELLIPVSIILGMIHASTNKWMFNLSLSLKKYLEMSAVAAVIIFGGWTVLCLIALSALDKSCN